MEHHNNQAMPDIRAHSVSGSTIPDPASVAEHGRTFHGYKEGKYLLPNDAIEQDRLDFQHKLWLMLMGGALHWAPLRDPTRVLDIGTGTGIWAIDFAEKYPRAHVTGTDLSLIQPANAPPNCLFVREDVEDEWTLGPPWFSNSASPTQAGAQELNHAPATPDAQQQQQQQHLFDYVHLRLMVSAFRLGQHRAVMAKIRPHVRPGGWVEFQDATMDFRADDGSMAGTALELYSRLIREGARALGRDFDAPSQYGAWLRAEGYVDVVGKRLHLPGNTWPTDRHRRALGMWCQVDVSELVAALAPKVLGAPNGCAMDPEAVSALVAEAQRDIADTSIRWYAVW